MTIQHRILYNTRAGSNHLDKKCDISKSYTMINDFITAEATAMEVKGKIQYC
jgi:hypothetical protein